MSGEQIDRLLQLQEVVIRRPKRSELSDARLEGLSGLEHPEDVVGLQFADGEGFSMSSSGIQIDMISALPDGPGAVEHACLGQSCHGRTDGGTRHVHLRSQHPLPRQHVTDLQLTRLEPIHDLADDVTGHAARSNGLNSRIVAPSVDSCAQMIATVAVTGDGGSPRFRKLRGRLYRSVPTTGSIRGRRRRSKLAFLCLSVAA